MSPLDDRFQHVLPRRLGSLPRNAVQSRYNEESNMYPAAAQAMDVERPSSVSDRAQRILSIAREVENMAYGVLHATCPPGAPGVAASKAEPPEPSHIVFTLEEAERRLHNAHSVLNEALQAIV